MEGNMEAVSAPQRNQEPNRWERIYEKFFCAEGRTNRKQYWAIGLSLCAGLFFSTAFLFVFVKSFLGPTTPGSRAVQFSVGLHHGIAAAQSPSVPMLVLSMVWLLFVMAVAYAGIRTILRRWHDIGHTEEALLKYVLYPLVGANGAAIPLMLLLAGPGKTKTMYFLSSILTDFDALFIIGMFLYLGVRSGTRGINAYGPEPAGHAWDVYITERTCDPRSWKQMLFTWKGRMSRKTYIFCIFGIMLANMVLNILFNLLSLPSGSVLIGLAFIAVSMMLQAQRLHDMGKSAKPLMLAFIVFFAAIFMAGFFLAMRAFLAQSGIALIILLAITAAALFIVVTGLQIALRKGTEGENRYGMPCLEKIAELSEKE